MTNLLFFRRDNLLFNTLARVFDIGEKVEQATLIME